MWHNQQMEVLLSTTYTIKTNPAPPSLIDKIGVVFTVHLYSGTNPTLQWGTLTAKLIKNQMEIAQY